MRDGLYRVVTRTFVAGFVIKDGRWIACAPILRGAVGYWMRYAKWVCP